MSTLYCGGGVQTNIMHAQMLIQCFECTITEIYLLLVARNLLKFALFYFLGFETCRLIGR